jgi:hypothetical protein
MMALCARRSVAGSRCTKALHAGHRTRATHGVRVASAVAQRASLQWSSETVLAIKKPSRLAGA